MNTTGILRDLLRRGEVAPTWDNVTRWIEGIRGKSWEEVEKIDQEQRRKTLSTIAAVNLKKTTGGSSSDMEEIRREAIKYRRELNEQVDIYDASLIICCGRDQPSVGRIFEAVVGHKVHWEVFRGVSYEVRYHRPRRDRLVIDYYHPQQKNKKRWPDRGLFTDLVAAVRGLRPIEWGSRAT